jgi:membrane-associated phospholipid phosphatase
MAAQDWLLVGYFTLLSLAVLSGSGPYLHLSYAMVTVDVAILGAALVLVRGGVVQGGLASFIYRAGVFLPVFISYFQLRWILPTVTTRALDVQLYAFDTSVFGVEPAVAWDRFVNPSTTEWFAFFYFGYFFIMGAHIFPFLFVGKDGVLLRHFALGIFVQFCTTHLLYMVVPGFGPYKVLTFTHALDGGTFRDLVMSSVHSAGAQKDIFPSLHTGAPTFLTVFSFLHRDRVPFKYTWPILAFIVSQIIIATMFLRWHYLIDIIAGFTLATTNAIVTLAIVRREMRAREARGAMPIFGPSLRG